MLEDVTVYRVENACGQGMYRNITDARFDMQEIDGHKPRHPTPSMDDGIRDVWNKYACKLLFGFGSLEQLKFWIYKREWREELSNSGFSISVIKGMGKIGDTQAVFHKEQFQRIQTISLLDI